MPDPFYPTIDATFLEQVIENNPKVIPGSKIKVGATTVFVLEGDRPISKRHVLMREVNPNEISFENATGIAIKLGCMGELLKWYEKNKNWKDGGYFVP